MTPTTIEKAWFDIKNATSPGNSILLKDLKFKVCRPSSIVRHPYLLSSRVSTSVHRISPFYSTDRVFSIHYYVNPVQVLFTDYYLLDL